MQGHTWEAGSPGNTPQSRSFWEGAAKPHLPVGWKKGTGLVVAFKIAAVLGKHWGVMVKLKCWSVWPWMSPQHPPDA